MCQRDESASRDDIRSANNWRATVNVGQICRRRVVTIAATEDLATAARLMRESHIGYLIVVEPAFQEGQFLPVGVLTDRDIVVSVVAREADPRMLRVGDAMTPRPVTIMDEDSVADAVDQMKRIGVRRLPVIGDYGVLKGVLSMDDVLSTMAHDLRSVADAVAQERAAESGLRP
jgi:CBS domain-containing protein